MFPVLSASPVFPSQHSLLVLLFHCLFVVEFVMDWYKIKCLIFAARMEFCPGILILLQQLQAIRSSGIFNIYLYIVYIVYIAKSERKNCNGLKKVECFTMFRQPVLPSSLLWAIRPFSAKRTLARARLCDDDVIYGRQLVFFSISNMFGTLFSVIITFFRCFPLWRNKKDDTLPTNMK